jgi:hypothetical protein
MIALRDAAGEIYGQSMGCVPLAVITEQVVHGEPADGWLSSEGGMRSVNVVQRDDGTPTGPKTARCAIPGIRGLGVWFAFMR